jgi:Apea-like HEPN
VYSFRNGVRTAAHRRLVETVPEFVLSEHDNVVLLPANAMSSDALLSKTTIFVIQGSGYQALDEAFKAAREWRQYLTIGAARQGFPIEIGGLNEQNLEPHQFPTWNRNLVKDELLQKFNLERSDRILVDRIGLMVYETEPAAKFIYPDWPDSIVGCSAKAIRVAIGVIRTGDPTVWSNRISLAYRIVHASLIANDDEARYILLVTAIEAILPDKQERSTDVVGVIDSLIKTLANTPAGAARDVVAALLREDKNESIGRLGAELANQLSRQNYGGMTAKKYFQHIYGTRSRLVHGHLNRLSDDIRDVIDDYKELLQFVLDMLEESAKSIPG